MVRCCPAGLRPRCRAGCFDGFARDGQLPPGDEEGVFNDAHVLAHRCGPTAGVVDGVDLKPGAAQAVDDVVAVVANVVVLAEAKGPLFG